MTGSWTCVDANLIIRLVVDPQDTEIRRLWEEWEADGTQIAAPTLLFYEVSNALYRYERAGVLSAETVDLALRAALALPIQLYGEPRLHRRALAFAERFSLPAAYDAHYLALADMLDGTFWTADQRLVATVAAELPWVRAAAITP